MILRRFLRPSPPGTFRFIWELPILLAALTAFGLLAALLGVGIWHYLAWLALVIPIFVGLRYGLWPRHRARASADEQHSARRH